MKNIIKGFGLALALVASSAHAIPTLFFDGDISFDTSSGLLSVTSVLTATQDVAPAPELLGSSLDFTALFSSGDDTNAAFTAGYFATAAGTDLTVIDGDTNSLLTGNFSSLVLKGGNGLNSGLVKGALDSTGGSLQNEFGIGNLIALQFNLTTSFSATMFDSDFTGAIDGRIAGEAADVPESSTPALLALGMLFIGFVNRAGIKRQFNV